MRAPRLSVRQLLVAVAVVALLIPFPWEALVLSLATGSVWIVPPVLIVLFCGSVGDGRTALVATVCIVGSGSYYLPGFRHGPIYPEEIPFFWFLSFLTPINLAGPIIAARRYWHDKRLVSGEIQWAWMGLVWVAMLVTPGFRSSGRRWIAGLELLVEFARLTSVLALLLAFYGKRPAKPDPVWSHRIGWAVAECDVIAWGWYAII